MTIVAHFVPLWGKKKRSSAQKKLFLWQPDFRALATVVHPHVNITCHVVVHARGNGEGDRGVAAQNGAEGADTAVWTSLLQYQASVH